MAGVGTAWEFVFMSEFHKLLKSHSLAVETVTPPALLTTQAAA